MSRRTPSPLRYPGGKTSIYNMMSDIIVQNDLRLGTYVEPFAGGCGLALKLLFTGQVAEVHLNDIDKDIYAFWNSVLYKTNEFIEKIESTPVTLKERENQINIMADGRTSELNRGFATFFLNRTNRSGIIKRAGPIGGLSQKGNYKVDCRFNKEALIQKLKKIESYKEQITFYNEDAVDFIQFADKHLDNDTFFCIDPPYYKQGESLYTSFYKHIDHLELSETILALKKPWVLTYDNASEIKEMYKKLPQYNFNINYSAQEKKTGTELLIAPRTIKIPNETGLAKVA